jgi:hypothetical protein
MAGSDRQLIKLRKFLGEEHSKLYDDEEPHSHAPRLALEAWKGIDECKGSEKRNRINKTR